MAPVGVDFIHSVKCFDSSVDQQKSAVSQYSIGQPVQQRPAVQHSTAQYSTVQHSTARTAAHAYGLGECTSTANVQHVQQYSVQQRTAVQQYSQGSVYDLP